VDVAGGVDVGVDVVADDDGVGGKRRVEQRMMMTMDGRGDRVEIDGGMMSPSTLLSQKQSEQERESPFFNNGFHLCSPVFLWVAENDSFCPR